jgi:four helix bundle protein
MVYSKIKSFTDLDTWKQGHALVVSIYKLTHDFPKAERYGLIDQLRRAAISVTSNIAEGFSRQGNKEKVQFYYMAKGSLTELQNQLLVAKDVGYLDQADFDIVATQTITVGKLLTGLIKSAKQR